MSRPKLFPISLLIKILNSLLNLFPRRMTKSRSFILLKATFLTYLIANIVAAFSTSSANAEKVDTPPAAVPVKKKPKKAKVNPKVAKPVKPIPSEAQSPSTNEPGVQSPLPANGPPISLLPKPSPATAPAVPPVARVRDNNPGGEGKLLRSDCADGSRNNMISNRTMACAVCVTDSQGSKSTATRSRSTINASSKWFALIATAGHLCRRPLNAQESLHLVQGLGHCSKQTFDWKPDEESEGLKRNLVMAWQNGQSLDQTSGGKFSEIYGVETSMVENIFCPGIKANYKRLDSDLAGLWVQRASKMTEMDFNFAASSNDSEHSYSNSAIHKCLKEAKANGSRFNLADSQQECHKFESASGTAAKYVLSKMEQNEPVLAANDENPNECWVSFAATKRAKNSTITLINPNSPERSSNDSFNVIQYNSETGANPKRSISMMTVASKDACTDPSRIQQNYVAPDKTTPRGSVQ